MSGGLLKISEAASLAFHAMYLLARAGGKKLSAQTMAKQLSVSADHLAKVMQRLVAAKLANSLRGPTGGFSLAGPASKTTLMQIYEAIHGPFESTHCLLKKPVCAGGSCLLGGAAVPGRPNGGHALEINSFIVFCCVSAGQKDCSYEKKYHHDQRRALQWLWAMCWGLPRRSFANHQRQSKAGARRFL